MMEGRQDHGVRATFLQLPNHRDILGRRPHQKVARGITPRLERILRAQTMNRSDETSNPGYGIREAWTSFSAGLGDTEREKKPEVLDRSGAQNSLER